MDQVRNIINLTNVCYIRENRKILNSINWRVVEGERWAILGANGSGKTSLLNIISGYIWPTRGRIEVLGKVFGEFDLRKLRKDIGFISPDLIQLIPKKDTFEEVILSGKFASFGLFDKLDNDDLKYANEIISFVGGEEIRSIQFQKISQGEKQRCLIGRALMSNPNLLLLDEPYQGLDLPNREKLLKLIEKMGYERKDVSIILTTHHTEEIPSCFNKALFLKNGEILEKGAIKSIITSKKISNLFDLDLIIKKIGERYFTLSFIK